MVVVIIIIKSDGSTNNINTKITTIIYDRHGK